MKISIERIRELETIIEKNWAGEEDSSDPLYFDAIHELISILRSGAKTGQLTVHQILTILTFNKSYHVQHFGQRILDSLRR